MNARIAGTAGLAPMRGFSLVEFMVAGLIGVMLLTGLVQVAAGARGSFVLQEGIAEVQESARFAHDSVAVVLRQSGFLPQPWEPPPGDALTAANADAATAHGDRVALRSWSDRNCFDAVNPDRDAAGKPAFYLRESVLDLTAAGNLALTCRYGPDEDALVTQIPRQGLLPGIEAFQALYAEDADGDGRADRWVRAGGWSDPARIVGIEVGLLVASREPAAAPESRTFNVLDHVVTAPADGRLRRVVAVAHAFRGRLR